jgi:membrane protein YqaA with SNARE-associated domain
LGPELDAYLALFAGAFLAATLLPFSSEAMLAGLLALRPGEALALFAVATIGNTAGAIANWLIGRFAAHWAKADVLARARCWFGRWGQWSLLFSWVPVIGDPLTVAAGLLRVGFARFVVLVALGKAARYALVIWGVFAVSG